VKPPKRITIGPHTYRVVVDRAAIDRISAQSDRHVGQCCHETLVITVDPDLARSQMAETILHEVLHGAFSLIGACDVLSYDQEESVVRRLSPVLLEALRANERLVSWLTEP
jgi:hypothetical protein